MHISCSPQETNIEKGYDHETGVPMFPKQLPPAASAFKQATWKLKHNQTNLAKCQYFTGVATGTNKYLQAHVDKDVTIG